MSVALTELDTANISGSDRFEQWRELCLRGMFGVVAEASADLRALLDAKVSLWSAPAFTRIQYRSTPMLVSRSGQEAAKRPWNSYLIYKERQEGVQFVVGGITVTPQPGEFVVLDADEVSFTTQTAGRFGYDGWLLPKTSLAPHLPATGRPLSCYLPGQVGMTGLLGTYLDALGRDMSLLDGATGPVVLDTLSRLVAVACGAAPGSQASAVQAAELARARRYIDTHLADPLLSPARAARALGISLRKLHLLFEQHDTSFAGQVQRQRLWECRRVLESDFARSRSVTDVAYAWGYGSLSSFYRAFRDQFGCAPGDLRSGHAPTVHDGAQRS